MRAISTFTDRLVSVSTVIGVVAVLFMIAHISLDVLMRNLFLSPIPATSVVVANYYMPVIAFLPLALTEKLDQHVSVDLLFTTLPRPVQIWLLRIVRLGLGLAAGYVANHFLNDALRKYQLDSYVKEAGLEVPDWPGYFTLPVGFGLFALVLFCRLAESFFDPGRDFREGEAAPTID